MPGNEVTVLDAYKGLESAHPEAIWYMLAFTVLFFLLVWISNK